MNGPPATDPPHAPVSVAATVGWATAALAAAGVENPRLDAQLLLGHLLGLSRAALLAAPERQLRAAESARYAALVARRRAGEPLAYITGTREWLDMTLQVDRRVLIPRPETELLAERAIAWARRHGARLAVDVGTGSGALAIALARHVPSLERVVAIDSSRDALEVARANCRAQGVEQIVVLREGSLLDPLAPEEQPHLLVANLPYVPAAELAVLQREIRDYEPRQALVGGARGDELILDLLAQARHRMAPAGALFLEIHHDQGPSVGAATLLLWPAAHVAVHRDCAGLDRIVEIMPPP
jgi:release factor glutamine methyltransferase